MLSTPWISRLVALLLLAAAVLAVLFWVIEPLRSSYATADAAIAQARELLARYERVASLEAGLEQRAADLQREGGATDSYLAGDTYALAAAALQRRVASLIASSGGGVSSVQVLPAREEGGLRRVTIRLHFSTTIEPLAHVLHALEAGTPVLFIDNLDIESRLPIEAAAGGDGVEPELAVSFDLYGFMRSAAADPSGGPVRNGDRP